MKIFQLSMLGLLFIFLTSCKKEKTQKLTFDEYGLPVIAKSGGNYFGYLLDGKPIWLHDPKKTTGHIKATYWSNEERFEFSSYYKKDNDDYSLYIKLVSAPKIGEYYELKEYRDNSNHTAILYKGVPSSLPPPFSSSQMIGYTPYDDDPSFIKIEHINEENRTISAVFEMKVKKQWSTEIISITKGRFDVEYSKKY